MADLADRQHGVVAFRQLLTLGYSRDAVQRTVRAGRLHRVHTGVYSVGGRRLSVHGRWMAAVLACGDAALLSHRSAADLWGVLTTDAPWVDVAATPRTRHRRRGIFLHRPRRLDVEDRSAKDGIPVTSVARTLLDVAPVVRPRQLRRAIDEADRLELFDLGAVERLMERSRGHHGLRPLRRELRDYRAPLWTRSELERRFLELCGEARLPRPETNVRIAGHEVDCVWRGERLVVELDGYAYHRGRAGFERDRARDADLQLAGCRVIRVTDRQLRREPARVVRVVRSLLRTAA